jgi:hypothetical protein
MQKVEGSNPFSRSQKSDAFCGAFRTVIGADCYRATLLLDLRPTHLPAVALPAAAAVAAADDVAGMTACPDA